MNNKKGLIIALVALVAIVALASVAYASLAPKAQQQMQSNDSAQTSSSNTTSSTADGDGTQDATGSSSSTNGSAGKDSEGTATEEDLKFPDFTVLDIDGNPVTLSSMQGKPVFMSFWATWCPKCIEEAPAIQKLYESYGDRVNFMMINVTDGSRETKEMAIEWYQAQDYTYPIYLDTELEASSIAGMRYLPTLFILDAQGNAVYAESGAMTEEHGTKLIEDVLNS